MLCAILGDNTSNRTGHSPFSRENSGFITTENHSPVGWDNQNRQRLFRHIINVASDSVLCDVEWLSLSWFQPLSHFLSGAGATR